MKTTTQQTTFHLIPSEPVGLSFFFSSRSFSFSFSFSFPLASTSPAAVKIQPLNACTHSPFFSLLPCSLPTIRNGLGNFLTFFLFLFHFNISCNRQKDKSHGVNKDPFTFRQNWTNSFLLFMLLFLALYLLLSLHLTSLLCCQFVQRSNLFRGQLGFTGDLAFLRTTLLRFYLLLAVTITDSIVLLMLRRLQVT